jgi:hypothetical protein
VRVGRSEIAVPAFGFNRAWSFATVPAGGRGSVGVPQSSGAAPSLELAFDFTGVERAAYASAAIPLAGKPLAMSVDVRADGSGVGVRAAFTNADGDRIAVTLARRADWDGWRRCTVQLPSSAVPPLVLRSLYAVASLGGRPVKTTGRIAFRDLRFEVAGSAAHK